MISKFIPFHYEIYKKHICIAASVVLMAANNCFTNKSFGFLKTFSYFRPHNSPANFNIKETDDQNIKFY